MKVSNNKDIRRANKSSILRYLLEHGMASRTELYKALDLSPAAVTLLVEELQSEGFVRENASGDSTGGRKPVLLTLEREGCFAVVLQPCSAGVHYSVMDLYLKVVREGVSAYTAEQMVMNLFSCIKATINMLLSEEPLANRKPAGIGVVISEAYEELTRHVVVESGFETLVLDLESALKLEYNVPVYLENAVTTKALSYFKRLSAEQKPILYVDWGEELQAVLLSQHAASGCEIVPLEHFDHIVVDKDGPHCSCGMNGCLKMFASLRAMYEQMRQAVSGNVSGGEKADSGEMLAYLEEHQEEHYEIFTGAMEALIAAVYNVSSLLNTSHVILGGEMERASWFQALLRRCFPQRLNRKLHITTDNHWDILPERGVGLVIVERYLCGG